MSIYQIRENDTFWSLAPLYNTTAKAIQDANPNIDPTKLKKGQYIIIPDSQDKENIGRDTFTSSASQSETCSSTNNTPADFSKFFQSLDPVNNTRIETKQKVNSNANSTKLNQSPSSKSKINSSTNTSAIHSIKSGDTFWSLARKYNTTVKAIQDANPNVDPTSLKKDQKIIIPGKSSSAQKTSAPKSNSSTQTFTKEQIVEKIKTAAKKYGIDENLALAVVEQESNFNPNALGKSGDTGLFQLTSIAAKQVKGELTFDVDKNIEYGLKYLKWCLNNSSTDEEALVIYNRGIGALKRAKANNIPIDSITARGCYAKKVMERQNKWKGLTL